MTDLKKINNLKNNTISKSKKNIFMADLLDKYDYDNEKINEGDIIEGEVIKISKNEVWVDVKRRGVGVVRGRELYDANGKKIDFLIGDKVLVYVLRLEDEDGYMVLSFRRTSREKVWRDLKQSLDKGEIISVKISEANKGGLLVQIGEIQGFIPASQLSPENYPKVKGGDKNEILSRLKKLLGKSIKVKVIDVDQSAGKLILSEKAACAEKRKKKVSGFKVDQIIKGKVTGIVDFGVFVDIGGIEGLVHISEVSWDKVDNLGDYVKVGQEIKVKIINIESDKVFLSIKKLTPDPWVKAVGKYKPNQIISGKITRITPFGAFVNIDNKIDGLVHISEITTGHISNPQDVLGVGEKLEFKILSIDPENHKLELSLKDLKQKSKREVKKSKEISKLEEIEGITSPILGEFKKAGFTDIKALSSASEKDLVKIKGIGEKKAKEILKKVKKL